MKRENNPSSKSTTKKLKVKQFCKSKDRYGAKTAFDVKPDMPGIILFCDRGREKKCIAEANELFHKFAEEEYPEVEVDRTENDSRNEDSDEEEDIEAAIQNEIDSMKKGNHKQKYLFRSMKTQIECMAYMLVKSPVEPVSFVRKLLEKVSQTGITHSRYISRMVPVSNTCFANPKDMEELAKKLFAPHFHTPDSSTGEIIPKTFAIVFKARFRGDIVKEDFIKNYAAIVGTPHKVDLSNPELTVVIEIFKSICAIGVLRDFHKFKRYNIQSVAEQYRKEKDLSESASKQEAANEVNSEDQKVVEEKNVEEKSTVEGSQVV